MLNPESVDYSRGKIKLTFTDENADSMVKIYLTEEDAWKLHQMIQDRCNMPARRTRTEADEKFDPMF